MCPDRAPLLVARGIEKRFPGVVALRGVDVELFPGEVVSVVGENGAGKSTLMKVLAGVHVADAGELRIDGEPTRITSVREALSRGIALIHQELNLAENLSVGANILLGREPVRRGLIDEDRVSAEAEMALRRVGLDVLPTTLVGDLAIGQRQLIEIAKALSVDARVVIMDEPTSSLSHGETETLFSVVRRLREQGVCVLYISHRLGEVTELSDRALVMRDGALVGELPREELEHDKIVRLMVGRDLTDLYQRGAHGHGEVALTVKGLRTSAHPDHSLSFELRRGEIVGVAGLVGAGRTELLEALFGVTPAVSGEVRVSGLAVRISSPRDAIEAGLALVPEDRKSHGLVLPMSVRENVSLATLGRQARRGWLDRAAEARTSEDAISTLAIKTPTAEQIVRYLSGGNQQKVVLGRWLASQPAVLLLDEPTRGVDVGAKQEIYSLMHELAAQGMATLFVSSEMEEMLRMSDRALVMHEGRIRGELPEGRAVGGGGHAVGDRRRDVKKVLGILGLLVAICALTALLSDHFLTAYNIENLLRRSSLFGIIGIGVSFVIITGGIDLSIGSLVGLTGVLLPILLKSRGVADSSTTLGITLIALGAGALLVATMSSGRAPTRRRAIGTTGAVLMLVGVAVRSIGVSLPAGVAVAMVVLWVLGIATLLGVAHGLLVTRVKLQPFVVTLCGLLIYRGAARGVSGGKTVGFGDDFPALKSLATGKVDLPGVAFSIPAPVFILLGVAICSAVLLNRTVWGRYLKALGNNEEAARYSGIDTSRMIVLAYVLCAFLTGLGGVLFVLDVNSAQPADHGNFYELYAIAAAVLGGCSLRGGEGTITGVVIGAAVMQVLQNSINLLGIPTELNFAIIGAVILIGVTVDEVVKQVVARRRARA